MSEHHLQLHVNALWTVVIIVALFIGNLSFSKSKGARYTFADAKIEHMLLKNHCITYSESQINYLVERYGDKKHDGITIKTPFNQWLKTLAGDPCEMLAHEIKREINN